MREIEIKPFTKFMRRDEIRKHFGKGVLDAILPEGKEDDLFGVLIDVKAIDRLDNPKIFMEYFLGSEK